MVIDDQDGRPSTMVRYRAPGASWTATVARYALMPRRVPPGPYSPCVITVPRPPPTRRGLRWAAFVAGLTSADRARHRRAPGTGRGGQRRLRSPPPPRATLRPDRPGPTPGAESRSPFAAGGLTLGSISSSAPSGASPWRLGREHCGPVAVYPPQAAHHRPGGSARGGRSGGTGDGGRPGRPGLAEQARSHQPARAGARRAGTRRSRLGSCCWPRWRSASCAREPPSRRPSGLLGLFWPQPCYFTTIGPASVADLRRPQCRRCSACGPGAGGHALHGSPGRGSTGAAGQRRHRRSRVCAAGCPMPAGRSCSPGYRDGSGRGRHGLAGARRGCSAVALGGAGGVGASST